MQGSFETPGATSRGAVANTTYRPPFRGRRFAVSSTHYLATMAGFKILERGGNAVDAGVAAGIALNVVEPHLTTFGGVAPIAVYLARTGQVLTISGLGRWPRAATLDYYLKTYGGDLPEGIPRTVVPAACDAWLTALEKFGTMTFEQVVSPALELASEGFIVYPRLEAAVAAQAERLKGWPSSAEVFLLGGQVPRVGQVLRQPGLARTFEALISAERKARGSGREAGLRAARDYFYRGPLAEEIVKFCQEQGGLLSLEDLAEFSVKVEVAAMTEYRGYRVYVCGPWCQGPVVAQTLNLLEGFDLRGLGHNTAEYLHVLVEALKLSFADREAYYGDPEFVRVPIDVLLSKGYAAERRKLIRPEQAWVGLPPAGETGVKPGPGPEVKVGPAEADTSYVCVVDAEGNAFSATPSDPALSSPLVPGWGFSLSSRGSQSWLEADHPSVLAPWKRPRLTPNPALALGPDGQVIPFGCPGGDGQTQAMVQVFVNLVDFGMNPQEAVEAPRVISMSFPNSFWPHAYYPGRLFVEGRIEGGVRAGLVARGHEVIVWPNWTPAACAVCLVVAEPGVGRVEAGADPRRDSYAVGW
ncbi:MAG: gamma-glutamyltransferase [Chloroflexota bacterium]